MDVLKKNIIFLVLLSSFISGRICAQNSTELSSNRRARDIPIVITNILGPRQFERIVVPLDPPSVKKYNNNYNGDTGKEIATKLNSPNNRNNGDEKRVAFSYLNRKDGHSQNPLIPTDTTPNDIQPLHVNTRVFKKTPPIMPLKESVNDKKIKFNNQEEILKLDNLPENPYLVPKTDWFDNLSSKYNYGIIHDDIQTPKEFVKQQDTIENESNEIIAPVLISHVQHDPLSPVKFRSNFNDPNVHAQTQLQNNNQGKFLYKTEVYYPNYRDHLYLPVATYYGNPPQIAKHFPAVNTHKIYHPPPSSTPSNINSKINHQENDGLNKRLLPVDRKIAESPKAVFVPRKNEMPITVYVPRKNEAPIKTIPQPVIKPTAEENSKDYDYDEEDEDSDDEDENDGSNDKITGNASEDEEEEEGDDDEEDEESREDENPKRSYTSYSSFNSPDSTEEDQFDKAWKKYGYAQQRSSSEEKDSFESSESQIIPQRKKIVHMKMEYYTRPHDGNDETAAVSKNDEEISKATETVDTETKKNKKNKKKKPNVVVKSQKPHPNAGPDGLKFFQ